MVTCHVISVTLTLIMDITKHHIVYHTHYISRDTFRNEFMQFLPLFRPDTQKAQEMAERRRLGLGVTELK